jgi:hypothetical protein
MKKIVIISEDNFKRMVKNFLLEQNMNFPPMKGVTVDNTALKLQGRNYAVGNEAQTYNLKGIRNRKNQEELGVAIAATAAAFIPFIGWAVSATILGYDAYNKFQEGRFRAGGSSTLFAILSVAIPALKLRNIYILSKMPKNEIAQLGTKVASGANLTKTEIQAVNEVINNADEIANGIQNLAKSKNLATALPASKFSSAVEKFKGEYLPYIVGKTGYEFGWEIGNAVTRAKSTGSNW